MLLSFLAGLHAIDHARHHQRSWRTRRSPVICTLELLCHKSANELLLRVPDGMGATGALVWIFIRAYKFKRSICHSHILKLWLGQDFVRNHWERLEISTNVQQIEFTIWRRPKYFYN
jgi:hypothetical protein